MTDGIQQVIAHQDYEGVAEILNLKVATLAASPMPKSQVDAELATKQVNLTNSNVIEVDGGQY